jgi:uncharacterized protein Usg
LSFGMHSQQIDMDLQQYMVIKGIWYIHLHDPKHLHNKYIWQIFILALCKCNF